MLTDEQINKIAEKYLGDEISRKIIAGLIREALVMNDKVVASAGVKTSSKDFQSTKKRLVDIGYLLKDDPLKQIPGPNAIRDFASRLHFAGLSALECPKCRCGETWHDYRMRIAERFFKKGIVGPS